MSKFSVAVCDWDGRELDLASTIGRSPFSQVYLCVEDRHLLWRQQNVHEIIAAFRAHGLDVILDPWGVSQMFAGEATSSQDYTFIQWLKFAETTKAKGILLDEPKQIETLESTIKLTREFAPSKEVHLAIQPEKLENLDDYLGFEKIDHLTVSTYIFEQEMAQMDFEQLIYRVQCWSKIIPEDASVWVQTWKIPEDKEWIVDLIIFLFKYYRPGKDINIWAWEACRTVSAIRPYNPVLVWRNVMKILRETKTAL